MASFIWVQLKKTSEVDLAKPLVFLASDAARYITGIGLEISGGKFTVQDCAMPWRFARGEQT